MGFWKYLFGNVYEINVIIDQTKLDEAREIFAKYNAHEQQLTQRLKVEFTDRDGSYKEKKNLCYLISSSETDDLSRDLLEQGIAGTTRMNSIILEPYSLRAIIAHWLYE